GAGQVGTPAPGLYGPLPPDPRGPCPGRVPVGEEGRGHAAADRGDRGRGAPARRRGEGLVRRGRVGPRHPALAQAVLRPDRGGPDPGGGYGAGGRVHGEDGAMARCRSTRLTGGRKTAVRTTSCWHTFR